MRPLVLFLLWPVAEIAAFVSIGGRIGLLPTFLVILGTAAFGIWLLRSRGFRSAGQMQHGLNLVRTGAGQIADDVLILLAALLLIMPGFLTDFVGLLLLIPPVRGLIKLWIAARFAGGLNVRMNTPFGQTGPQGGDRPDIVIDGDYIELDPDPKRPQSGWTRH